MHWCLLSAISEFPKGTFLVPDVFLGHQRLHPYYFASRLLNISFAAV